MKILKKTLKYILYLIFGIVSILAIYLITERVLSRSTVEEIPQEEVKSIQVYLLSNGVHTDIVVPVKTEEIDWNTIFPFENTIGKRTDFKYVAIGWGDKGFYLDTPEWSDLKASTAINAAIGNGTTALHVTYYDTMKENELSKKTMISIAQYKKLIQFINNSLQKRADNKSILIETTAQYGRNDAFYEAKGSYSIFHTCNTWTNNALKFSGMKASKWVAFDKGILYQYTDNQK